MSLDEQYICQRAANAIISEIGPFRVSTDALQIVNQFLDEFIVLLFRGSLSLDLSEIKSTVFNLLPSTLGKNAIVEAELEVKTFTETESIDYDLYERMRKIEKSKFPIDEAVSLLREKCFEYCTLADKEDQLYLQKSMQKKKNGKSSVEVSPIVSIYVTTVMEHIAEYLLTAVAMSAEHEETDYVRVKEVYFALLDDVQLGNVFNKMKLKEKMEKRTTVPNKNRTSYLPNQSSVSTSQHRKSYINTNNYDVDAIAPEIDLDEDLDLDYFDENIRKSQSSAFNSVRPHSVMSHHSNASRKSTFHVFKNNRNSFSAFDSPSRSSSPTPSIYDPDMVPTMNFDELVKSGGTVKVSLTPNRLRSIEVKDQTKDEPPVPELTWERRSMSSSRLPSSPTLSRQESKKSTGSQKEKFVDPKWAPKSPVSPLAAQNFTRHEYSQFENPREAPKPPLPATLDVAPLKKPLAPLARIPSHTTKLSKVPEPIQKRPLVASSTEMSFPSSSTSTESTPSIQGPPSPVIPLPALNEFPKEALSTTQDIQAPKISCNVVVRRGSLSSRKSRENLRKKKSNENAHTESKNDTVKYIERPSSMVAKRASMVVGNTRYRSMYEDFSAESSQEASPVSASIKQWDMKSEENLTISRSTRRQEPLEQVPESTNRASNAVLDKVLKFERASSLDAVAHHRVSNLPRRERFLYLQQDPSAIERKSTIRTSSRPQGIDQGTQTESIKKDEEEGLVEGDEEWFLQDDEWDEQEETAIVEWLLCD
ncbi:hypothetical protein BY458DRAFT_554030 [Sporodiniella umbellata]|nr:hypothetical protein BY458DRAFT_554030 [Sporodiniella umbellata]